MHPHNLLQNLNYEEEIEVSGRRWNFRAMDIADYRGMTTKLDHDIWLDWHDVLSNPSEARMHMFPGALKDTTLAVKRMRMETWQAAIVAFDDMMVDVGSTLTAHEVRSLLVQQKLPRPTYVALPTANPSLIHLLADLGITSTKKERACDLYDEWRHFADIARRGGIVRRKLAKVISET